MTKMPFKPYPVKILHGYLSNELEFKYGVILDCDMECQYPYFVKLFKYKPELEDCYNISSNPSGQSIDEEWLDCSGFEKLIE